MLVYNDLCQVYYLTDCQINCVGSLIDFMKSRISGEQLTKYNIYTGCIASGLSFKDVKMFNVKLNVFGVTVVSLNKTLFPPVTNSDFLISASETVALVKA